MKDSIIQLQASGYDPVRSSYRFSMGSLSKCKNILAETFKSTDLTINEFQFLDAYRKVVEWMHDNKGKGIGLVGSNGTGKTTILMSALPVLFLSQLNKVFMPYPSVDLPQDLGKIKKWAVGIDDVGAEWPVNNFGNKFEPVSYAIDYCDRNMKLLLFTSNLSSEELIQRYGIRIMDRIKRLCRIVEFQGKSLRK